MTIPAELERLIKAYNDAADRCLRARRNTSDSVAENEARVQGSDSLAKAVTELRTQIASYCLTNEIDLGEVQKLLH